MSTTRNEVVRGKCVKELYSSLCWFVLGEALSPNNAAGACQIECICNPRFRMKFDFNSMELEMAPQFLARKDATDQ
jgi:hypothetical protein